MYRRPENDDECVYIFAIWSTCDEMIIVWKWLVYIVYCASTIWHRNAGRAMHTNVGMVNVWTAGSWYAILDSRLSCQEFTRHVSCDYNIQLFLFMRSICLNCLKVIISVYRFEFDELMLYRIRTVSCNFFFFYFDWWKWMTVALKSKCWPIIFGFIVKTFFFNLVCSFT